ncbi:MAG: hypothetical protein R2764_14335 [Bacteroidales bacterium]
MGSDLNHIDPRFPVQYVVRPQTDEFHDYRGYAGRISGGVFRKGRQGSGFTSGFVTTIESIDLFGEEYDEVFPPMSVTFRVNRRPGDKSWRYDQKKITFPEVSQNIDVMMC